MLSSEFKEYFEKFPCINDRFLGVFAINNFPRKIANRHFFICNLSKSDQMGTHWIALLKSEPQTIEIFDPLATKIDLLKPYINFRGSPTIYYNDGAFQLNTSTTCGMFCIMFIIERFQNFDLKYKQLLAEIFSIDPKINEKIVSDFITSL